jgi:aerobic-type carbon monoxide dehydrogenase small subunit (CoxS/CutS family)
MPVKNKKKSGEISRREFLKDAGLLVGGTAIGSTVLLAACGGGTTTETVTKTVTSTVPGGTATVTSTVPGGTATVTTTVPGGTGVQTVTITKTVEAPGAAAENVIKLTINGEQHEVQIEPFWTLQYLIHDIIGLTGIKDMCLGYGACGSCTIIMNGRPILSCMALAIESDGAVIETAENLGLTKHPLVDAYIKYSCMQCGYCTPGFILTAKALLDQNPKPTEDEIRDALAGNICRCGTYGQHVLAVLEASGQS